MTDKITLTDLVNLQNETTTVNAINSNNAAITTAFNNSLSRDGTQPNPMDATLDMNSNRIINLPTAVSTSEPVSLGQMAAAIAAGSFPSGLTGVPVSAAMQPVVNASTTAAAQSLLGVSTYMQTLDALTSQAAVQSALGISTAALSGWGNSPNPKTANYTVVTADAGTTLALGGSAFYTLTFSVASSYPVNFLVYVVNTDTVRAKLISAPGITNFYLYPLQTVVMYVQNNVWYKQGPGLWAIPANNTTFFVDNVHGNDTNDGLAAGTGGALLTIQACLNRMWSDVNLNNHVLVMSMSAGTWSISGGVVFNQSITGSGQFTVNGNGAIITSSNNTTWNVSTTLSHDFVFENLQFNCGLASGVCLEVSAPCVVNILPGCGFGGTNAGIHMAAIGSGSVIAIDSNYKIVGGCNIHALVSQGGFIVNAASVVTITTAVAASAFIFASQVGIYQAVSNLVFSGASLVTGTRWLASGNSCISGTGGNAAFFPGSINGSASSGGQYI